MNPLRTRVIRFTEMGHGNGWWYLLSSFNSFKDAVIRHGLWSAAEIPNLWRFQPFTYACWFLLRKYLCLQLLTQFSELKRVASRMWHSLRSYNRFPRKPHRSLFISCNQQFVVVVDDDDERRKRWVLKNSTQLKLLCYEWAIHLLAEALSPL